MTAALGKIHTHTHIGFYFVARSLFTAIKPYIPRFSFSNVAIPYQVTHTHTHTQWDRLLQQEFMMNTLHYEQLLLFIDRNFKVIRTSMTYCDACQINRKEVIIKRIISNLHNESTKRNEKKIELRIRNPSTDSTHSHEQWIDISNASVTFQLLE